MRLSTRVSPVNSIVFIHGPGTGRPPEPIRGATILSTDSCISVACFPEIDGPTEIVLGKTPEVDPGSRSEFDGILKTPNHRIVVTTVDNQVVLATEVDTNFTRIVIWRSHPRWPEIVTIGLG
jgi:hypothetical protein